MHIGPYVLGEALALAPMAGVTDRPFRRLCRSLGAGWTVSEMVSDDPGLRASRKTRLRLDHRGEPAPRIVQIAGSEPRRMAEAARFNVAQGAQVIDVNMGCPAKKVCRAAAGSALLADECLVERILRTVVSAVDVPVTVKIRTGPDRARRNGLRIARIAEDCGVQAVAVHGRTRADGYRGAAEYGTAALIKATVGIPVIVNGDIDSPEKANWVKECTGADAIMIGRAAQGSPWIFREIAHYLRTGRHLPAPSPLEIARIVRSHLIELHGFYGEVAGVRIARKHIGWYLRPLGVDETLLGQALRAGHAAQQLALIDRLLAGAFAHAAPRAA